MTAMMKKKTSGRKKIEIKRIIDPTTRQVTFSKRRKGLFNKASELCVLTGARVAILVQSPGSRLFCFGDPSLDSIIDMYFGGNVRDVSDFSSTSENSNPYCMHDEFNKKNLEITKKLELEKKNVNNIESGEFWWEKSFKDLEVDQLENYIKSMEELKINVIKKADELMKEKENTSCSVDMNPNADNFDGLLDDQVSVFDDQFLSKNGGIVDEDVMKRFFDGLDDQVPVMDQFLPNNGGIVDEDLMMQAVNNDCSLINNDSLGSGDQLVIDNYYGLDDFQVTSDLWSNDFYFGQGQQI